MYRLIHPLPIWLLILTFAGCTRNNAIPNIKKIAAIKQKKENSYKNNRAVYLLQGNVAMLTTCYYNSEVTDTIGTTFDTKEIFFFDSTGNCTERIIYTDRGFASRDVFKYDEKNRRTGSYSYAEDGSLQFIIYQKFDSQGNLVEDGQRQADGSTLFNTTREYDEQGAVTREVSSKADAVNLTYKNYYDEEGILKEQVVTTADGKQGKTIYRFDSLGNILEQTSLLGGKVFSSSKKRYNSKGFIISEIQESEGKPAEEVANKVDRLGNITKRYMQPPNENYQLRYAFQYTYDAHGNWTRAVSTQFPGQSKATIIRYLKYY